MYRIYGAMLKCIPAVMLIFLSGCEVFFERDLSGDTITLNSPMDNTITTLFTHEFSWEKLKGASEYQLQIAFPSFDFIQAYVLDTTITQNTFQFTLSPGTYQWRVRGKNGSSNSQYSAPFNLTIDTTSNLTYQTVVLTTPSSATMNTAQVYFSWQVLSIADSYNFILKSGTNWNTGTTIVNDTFTTNYYLHTTALPEGNYIWGVRAMNNQSYTVNYSTRTFSIDTTSPPVVSLVNPTNNSFQTAGTINFSWTRATDTGTSPSVRTDSIFVYSDTTFTTLTFREGISGTSTSKVIVTPGIYRWYVISYDAAGNFSDTSQYFKFEIQ